MANEKDTLEIEVKATLSGDAAFKSILSDLEKIRKEADKVKQSAAGIGGASGSIKSAATALGEVETAAKKAGKGVGEAEKSTESAGSAFTKMSTLATAAWAAAGAAVTAFVVDSVSQFMQFEKGMAEVFTLLPGISGAAMDAMTADVRAFALESGRLPDEVVPALYQAISAGVPQANVFDFMKVASDAALGGVTDLETAVDGITSVVNAYGSEVVSAQQASDIMFTAVKLGKTDFSQLSASLFNVIPTAAALGVSFEDVAAGLAAVTAQGTPTSVATTQMRQLFVELSKEGGNTSRIFKEIAGVGFKEFLAQGNSLQDGLQLLEEYAAKTNVGINDLFGSVEAGSIALGLTGQGTEKFTAAVQEFGNVTGATGRAADLMGETTAQSMARATAAINEFKLMLGESLAPALAETAEAMLSIANVALPLLESKLEKITMVTGAFANGMSIIAGTSDEVAKTVAGVANVVGDNALSAAEKMAQLDAAISNAGTGGRVFGHAEEIEAGMVQVAKAVVTGATSYEDAIARMKEAGFEMDAEGMSFTSPHEWEAFQAAWAQVEQGAVFSASQVMSRLVDVSGAYAHTGKEADDAAVFITDLTEELEKNGRAYERVTEATAANEQVNERIAKVNEAALSTSEAKNQLLKEEALNAGKTAESIAEYEAATKAALAATQAFVRDSTGAFNQSGSIFGDAFQELEKAENAQINLNAGTVWAYNQASKEITEISGQLAADLSEDQQKAFQDILGTVEEGSSEWLSAYNALQGDLSDSARQGLVAQMAELQGEASELAGGGLEAVYGADTRAAEEARAAIEEANQAIIASYKATAFEALLAQTGVTESTLALGVQLGIMTEAEAAARLEFTNTTLALTELASSHEFAAASTRDQAEATQLLILGYATSAEQAATMAASISDKGGLSESLISATSLTEELNLELSKLEGEKTGKVNVSVDGMESLREAVGLTEQIRRGNRSEAGATGDALPQARAVGGDVDAGSPYLVGEQGAELIFPSKSGFVATAAQTRQLLNEAKQAQAQMAMSNSYATNTANLSMTNNIYAGNQPAQDIASTIDRRGQQTARKMARLMGQKI